LMLAEFLQPSLIYVNLSRCGVWWDA